MFSFMIIAWMKSCDCWLVVISQGGTYWLMPLDKPPTDSSVFKTGFLQRKEIANNKCITLIIYTILLHVTVLCCIKHTI